MKRLFSRQKRFLPISLPIFRSPGEAGRKRGLGRAHAVRLAPPTGASHRSARLGGRPRGVLGAPRLPPARAVRPLQRATTSPAQAVRPSGGPGEPPTTLRPMPSDPSATIRSDARREVSPQAGLPQRSQPSARPDARHARHSANGPMTGMEIRPARRLGTGVLVRRAAAESVQPRFRAP